MSLSLATIVAGILFTFVVITFSALKICIALALGKDDAEREELLLNLLLREQRRRRR